MHNIKPSCSTCGKPIIKLIKTTHQCRQCIQTQRKSYRRVQKEKALKID